MAGWAKAVLFGAGVLVLAGGCAPRMYDDDGGYRHSYYRHHDDRYRDRDRDRWRDRDSDRRWVCDSDGDDCRWVYRRD